MFANCEPLSKPPPLTLWECAAPGVLWLGTREQSDQVLLEPVLVQPDSVARPRCQHGARERIARARLSRDHRLLVLYLLDGSLELLERETLRIVGRLPAEPPAAGPLVAPDGSAQAWVRERDVELNGRSYPVRGQVAFSLDSRFLLLAEGNGAKAHAVDGSRTLPCVKSTSREAAQLDIKLADAEPHLAVPSARLRVAAPPRSGDPRELPELTVEECRRYDRFFDELRKS